MAVGIQGTTNKPMAKHTGENPRVEGIQWTGDNPRAVGV